MNEDILKSQNPTPVTPRVVTPPPPVQVPDHPLDILHNQADPYHKAKGLASPKPIRTYESDVAEILAKQKSSVISIASAENDRKFSKKQDPGPVPVAPYVKPVEELAPIEPAPRVPPRLSDFTDPGAIPQKPNARNTGNPIPINKSYAVPIPAPSIPKAPKVEPPKIVPPPPIPQPPKPIPAPDKSLQEEARAKLQAVTDEVNRKEEIIETVKKSHRTKKIFLTLVSIIFIISGLLGAFYFYLNSPIAPVQIVDSPSLKIEGIIEVENQKIINLGILGQTNVSNVISDEIQNTPIGDMVINEIVPIHQVGTTTIKLTGTQFIEASDFTMPDTLKRSLTDKWMIGTYSELGQNSPFIIFTSDFFQNSFAGMLKWESNMALELANILNYQNKIEEDNASSTFSSLYSVRGTFNDKIIRNRDIREFNNEKGETLFLYTFLDQNTIIITTSEGVIPAIVDRIDKQTYMR